MGAGGESIIFQTDDFIPVLQFFGDIIQSFLDTYLTVLVGIEQIAGKHLALKEETLVQELHIGLKEMH